MTRGGTPVVDPVVLPWSVRRPQRRIKGGCEVRRERAAMPHGCRWCGIERRDHCQLWIRGRSWHGWTEPTRAQLLARTRALRMSRLVAPAESG